jgi:hypothetical protein
VFLTVFLTGMPAGDDQVFVGGESPTVCKGFTTCTLGFFQSAFKVTVESPRRHLAVEHDGANTSCSNAHTSCSNARTPKTPWNRVTLTARALSCDLN